MLPFKTINIFCWIFCFLDRFASVKNKPCKGTATYKLSFQAEWTESTSRPANAHFSGLIGCSHNHCYEMWKPGERASPGVKNVAERGDDKELDREIRARQIQLWKNALVIISSRTTIAPEGNVIVPETNRTEDGFSVDSSHPLVSVITGIVPSPDWFIGVQDISLCDTSTGEWLDSKRETLFPYDAGTDSGTKFNSSNDIPTNPPETIKRLERLQLNNFNNRGMGYFQFTLLRKFPHSSNEMAASDNLDCPNMAVPTNWSSFLIFSSLIMMILG